MYNWGFIVSSVSIVIAFISLYLAYRSIKTGKDSLDTLENVRREIESEFEKVKTTNQGTQNLIARIAKLFDASEMAGIEMVYQDRNEALREFAKILENTSDEVIIVGSSLLGLYLFITGFEDIVSRQPSNFKFILTHPDYSKSREGPEGRDIGVIEGEICEAIHKLTHWGVPIENIKLYKGSPTVFMIVASQHMLLNPYPYGTEAYRCFCIQVSSRGSIYKQYYDKHYNKIWDSNWIEKCNDFLEERKKGEVKK